MIMVGGMRSDTAFMICVIVICVFYIFVSYNAYKYIPPDYFKYGLSALVLDFLQSLITGTMGVPVALKSPLNVITKFLEPKKYLYLVDFPDGTYVSLLYFDKVNNRIFYETQYYNNNTHRDFIKIKKIQRYSEWITDQGNMGWAEINHRANDSLKKQYAAKGFKVDNLLFIPKQLYVHLNDYDKYGHLTKEMFDTELQTIYKVYQPIRPTTGTLRHINETIDSLIYIKDTLEQFRTRIPYFLNAFDNLRGSLLYLRGSESMTQSEIIQYNTDVDYIETMDDMASSVDLIHLVISNATALNDQRLTAFINKLSQLKNSFLDAANTVSRDHLNFRVKVREYMVLPNEDDSVLMALECIFDNARIIGPAANLALEQIIDIINRPGGRPFFYTDPIPKHLVLHDPYKPFRLLIRIDLNDAEDEIIANADASLQQMLVATAPIGRKLTTAPGRAALTAFHDSEPVAEPAIFANDAALTDPISLEDIQAGEKYAYWIGGNGPQIIAFTWNQFQAAADNTALFHIADGTIVNLPYEPVTSDGRIKVLLANTHYAIDQFRWAIHGGLANIAQILRKRRTQAEITAANASAFLERAGPIRTRRRGSTGGRRRRRRTRKH
jgi:hypothetical protein